jgi:hypothetical protein
VIPALDDVTPLKAQPDDWLLEEPPSVPPAPAPVALAPPAPPVALVEVLDVALDSAALVAPPVVVVGSTPPEIEMLAQ